MSRIRTIKPDFFRHEGLYEAEQETGLPLRIAFAGLWTAADREGRFAWRPRQLKLDCLPYDDVDFSRVLDALTTRGFLVRYRQTTDDGEHDYAFIPSWGKHQVINPRERESELPDPDKCELFQYDADACPTRAPRDSDLHVHARGEGEGELEGKGKGREGEGKGNRARERAALSWPFEQFWIQFPNKVGKQDALKAFHKVECSKATTFENLMLGLMRYAAKTDDRPWCNPATWLNQGRWEDQPAASNGNAHAKTSLSDRAFELAEQVREREREAGIHRPPDPVGSH